jgi:GDPmannose 4,6-dehydratase
MWLMLQQETPDDFAIGTGESHTVREFVDLAFTYADLDWRQYVDVDARYFRPAEVDYLCADPSKARTALRWEPTVTFPELVQIMVEADLKFVESRLKGGVESLQHAIAAEGRHS